MREASDALEFERAGRLRDRLAAVRKAIEKQQMVTERAEDLDCFGLVEDELEAAIQVFYVRRGRVVGRKGFIVDKVEDLTRAQLVAQVLEQHYDDAPLGVPPLVLVPEEPDEAEHGRGVAGVVRPARCRFAVDCERPAARPLAWATSSGGRPPAATGWSAASTRRPAPVTGWRSGSPSGARRRPSLEMVTRNAGEEFTRHRLKRAADHNARARALNALQDALDLPEAPLRIECYDMSHLQGTDYVGSMVVMEDGLPRPAGVPPVQGAHRRGQRRLRRHGARSSPGASPPTWPNGTSRSRSGAAASPTPRSCSWSTGQGSAPRGPRVLEELGLEEEIPVAALAKQFEEVYLPGRADPVRIPRTSEALYLLQQIRDEAHRFAITYHRKLRGKRMTASILDGIPGLGPNRKKRLIRELGGMKAVKGPRETLEQLPWLPERWPRRYTAASRVVSGHAFRLRQRDHHRVRNHRGRLRPDARADHGPGGQMIVWDPSSWRRWLTEAST